MGRTIGKDGWDDNTDGRAYHGQVDAAVSVQDIDRLGAPLQPIAPLARIDLSPANLATLRASLDERRAALAKQVDTRGLTVEDFGVQSRHGHVIPCRIYRPSGASDRVVPLVVYFHSGAFALGNLDTDHACCVILARDAECAVLSVGYRLAPEHPFPAAFDDGIDVMDAAIIRCADWRLDADRVAVAGSSAGGGLAAALAIRARDVGGPPLRLQLLHQPVLDDRCSTPSMTEFESTPGFDSVAARLMWQYYLQGTAATPAAAPVRCERLAGLPPALVTCSELDPLRDEAAEYAMRLVRAGVATDLHLFSGTCHGFDSLAFDWSVSAQARAMMVGAIRAAFG